MLRRILAAVAAFAALGIAFPISASVVAAYDLAELTRQSEHVVVARVEATSARYDERRQIVTDVLVRVGEVGKGRAHQGEVLQMVVLGGAVGDVAMRVEGSFQPRVDDEAVFFLARHSTGHLVPVGLSQGVMPVALRDGRRMVMPGGAGLVLMRREASGRMVAGGPALDAPEAVESLVDRVRALAGTGAP